MVATHSTHSRFTSAHHLHTRFRRYGAQALVCRNKCIGMLPRILKEKIYEQQGFDSIFEYAAKFAGLSREQVSRALSLHAHFEDKPILAAALETGEVSMNKLAKIASIATNDNQKFLTDQAKLLSCRALETLVRDEKYARQNTGANPGTARGIGQAEEITKISNQNGLFEPKTDGNVVHVNSEASIVNNIISIPIRRPQPSLELSPEVQEKLLSLKNKGLDVNAILIELLEKRELEIEREKERIAAEQRERKKTNNAGESQKPSRYIPVKIRRILQKEHGTKCSIENCNRPSQHIHHTQRFALLAGQNNPSHAMLHNPRYLAPLCREHHQIAHSIDITFQEVRRRK